MAPEPRIPLWEIALTLGPPLLFRSPLCEPRQPRWETPAQCSIPALDFPQQRLWRKHYPMSIAPCSNCRPIGHSTGEWFFNTTKFEESGTQPYQLDMWEIDSRTLVLKVPVSLKKSALLEHWWIRQHLMSESQSAFQQDAQLMWMHTRCISQPVFIYGTKICLWENVRILRDPSHMRTPVLSPLTGLCRGCPHTQQISTSSFRSKLLPQCFLDITFLTSFTID